MLQWHNDNDSEYRLVLPRHIVRSQLDGRGTRPAPGGQCCCWRIATSVARLPGSLSPVDASVDVTVDKLYMRLPIYLPYVYCTSIGFNSPFLILPFLGCTFSLSPCPPS